MRKVISRSLLVPALFASFIASASGTVMTCDEASLDTALSGGGTVTFARARQMGPALQSCINPPRVRISKRRM
jgi:hypothetical protein